MRFVQLILLGIWHLLFVVVDKSTLLTAAPLMPTYNENNKHDQDQDQGDAEIRGAGSEEVFRSAEQWVVYNPSLLQELAIEEFIQRRKENNSLTMDADSPIMQRAKQAAIGRGNVIDTEHVGEIMKASLSLETDMGMGTGDLLGQRQGGSSYILTTHVASPSSSSADLLCKNKCTKKKHHCCNITCVNIRKI